MIEKSGPEFAGEENFVLIEFLIRLWLWKRLGGVVVTRAVVSGSGKLIELEADPRPLKSVKTEILNCVIPNPIRRPAADVLNGCSLIKRRGSWNV